MEQSIFAVIVSLVAVIFVFLFAMKKFSSQVEALAGDKFKGLIERFTNNRFKSVAVGAGVTSILQSSTAVSVMLVSLVDAGVLPFANSVGVIIGSNIGTTITTQLVAFKILNLAPYILILGFLLMSIKSKYNKYQHLGKSIFYFGLVFSSLFIISVLAGYFKESEIFISFISKTSNIFVAIIFGLIASTVLQSSLVVSSIVIIFVSGGLLSFGQAFGIILGSNIGTTTTALLASVVTGKKGKRVAMAHFMFNFLGVLIFIPFIDIFSKTILKIPIELSGQVAVSHLVFNLIIAIIFIIFINPFTRLILRMVK